MEKSNQERFIRWRDGLPPMQCEGDTPSPEIVEHDYKDRHAAKYARELGDLEAIGEVVEALRLALLVPGVGALLQTGGPNIGTEILTRARAALRKLEES